MQLQKSNVLVGLKQTKGSICHSALAKLAMRSEIGTSSIENHIISLPIIDCDTINSGNLQPAGCWKGPISQTRGICYGSRQIRNMPDQALLLFPVRAGGMQFGVSLIWLVTSAFGFSPPVWFVSGSDYWATWMTFMIHYLTLFCSNDILAVNNSELEMSWTKWPRQRWRSEVLGWVWVGVFFCGGKDWVFGGCDCWVFCCCFFYLNHDKVKIEFITKVISDIAICKVLYAWSFYLVCSSESSKCHF